MVCLQCDGGRFHCNAFVAARALHIAQMMNASLLYPLLELVFRSQVMVLCGLLVSVSVLI
jgi:hypothetical protein